MAKKEEKEEEELEALDLTEEEIDEFLDTFKKIKLRWMKWGTEPNEKTGENEFFFTFFRVATQKNYRVAFPKEKIEVLKALREMLDDFIGEDEKEKDSLRAYE